MSGEVHGLAEFYRAPLGRVAARLVGARVAELWPDVTGLEVLGLGWPHPIWGCGPARVAGASR